MYEAPRLCQSFCFGHIFNWSTRSRGTGLLDNKPVLSVVIRDAPKAYNDFALRLANHSRLSTRWTLLATQLQVGRQVLKISGTPTKLSGTKIIDQVQPSQWHWLEGTDFNSCWRHKSTECKENKQHCIDQL